MRASAGSHANAGVTCVGGGEPWTQGCVTGKEWRKTRAGVYFRHHVPTEEKIYCPLQHPLKGWTGPTAGAVNHLWGLLLPNLETLCNLYRLVSLVLRRPGSSPPGRPSACPTCGPRREVLQRRPLHHGVGVPHHKHFVEHSVVVDEALDHAGRFDVLQVLFAEDDGHLGDTGTRTDLWTNQCHCVHKRQESQPAGMKTIWTGLNEGLIDFCGHAKMHKVRPFICLPCLNLS